MSTQITSTDPNPQVQDPSLGTILQKSKGWTAEQVGAALDYQKEHGVRFGEAAVALGMAQPEDVIWALSQQFHYPYAPTAERNLHDELVVANAPFSEEVETFRDLRSQLIMGPMSPTNPNRCPLAITSANAQDGKTFITANLGVAFSQLPGRTLIIDADLRKPRLHELFGIEPSTGLSSILAGRTEANVIKPVAHLPNLYLLPAGVIAPNPTELLQRAAFSLLLKELLNKFDHVLVDTPAACYGSDGRIIANHCGAALVVARKDNTKVAEAQKLIKLMSKHSVKMLGVLMNEV